MNSYRLSVIFVALAITTLFVRNLHAQDTQAPQLQSIALSPTAVNITAGVAMVTVTMAITDDDSGLNYGVVYLYGPGNQFISSGYFNTSPSYLQSGDPMDGVYQTTIEVPPYGPAGTWTTRLIVYDMAGNSNDYQVGGEPFPTPGDELLSVTNTGPVDTQSPEGTLLSVFPDTVNVSTAPQTITVELHITDDLVGFDYGFIDLINPLGNYVDVYSYFDTASLASGDALDGYYSVGVEIPQNAMQGTWTLTIYLRDRLGNWISLNNLSNGDVSVINGGNLTGGLADALDATQYPVSTGGDAEWFFQSDITFDGIDAAQSGPIGDLGYSYMDMELEGPGTLSFWWRVDSQGGMQDVLSVEVSDGVYYNAISGFEDWSQVFISIPSGTHWVTWTYSKNASGSFGADAVWVDRVYFASDSDQELPVLQYFSISPNPVDISSGDVELTITLEVSDDSNGILEGNVRLYDAFGDEYTYLYFNSDDLTFGDSQFGTYQFSTTLYQGDFIPSAYWALGMWRAEIEIVEDYTYNSRYYGLYDNPFPIPGAELFTVADGIADTQGPQLVSFGSITPNPANASGGEVAVTVSLRITDDQSGFDYGWLSLYNPDGNYTKSVYLGHAQRVSGDELDGNYQVIVTVPQYAPEGQWRLDLTLFDQASNEQNYPYDTPFPVPGSELFDVINNNNPDTAKPVLQSISISPDTVDTTAGAQNITINLSVSDNLSGIDVVVLSVYDPNGTYVNSLYRYFDGDGATNGNFQATLNLPQGSQEGTWTCRVYMRDTVGNLQTHGPYGDPFPNPGEELFTVGPVESSTTWGNFVNLHGLTGLDALPGANPDKDGMINILEMLLGYDPNVAESATDGRYGYTVSGGFLHLEFTVHPSLTATSNGQYLNISDGVSTPSQVSGYSASSLAGPWSLVQPTFVSGSTYRVSAPVGPGNPAFLQLIFIVP